MPPAETSFAKIKAAVMAPNVKESFTSSKKTTKNERALLLGQVLHALAGDDGAPDEIAKQFRNRWRAISVSLARKSTE